MTLVAPMQLKKEQMYHYKHTTFHMNQSCLVVAIPVHCLAALSDVQIPCSTYTGVHKPMQTCMCTHKIVEFCVSTKNRNFCPASYIYS